MVGVETLPASILNLCIIGCPLLKEKCHMKHPQIWNKFHTSRSSALIINGFRNCQQVIVMLACARLLHYLLAQEKQLFDWRFIILVDDMFLNVLLFFLQQKISIFSLVFVLNLFIFDYKFICI
jgi:hypothetical protein